MTDVPLPDPGDQTWSDWGADEEAMSDIVAAATDAATPLTLVKRDAAGRAKVVDGTAASDIVTKGQLDGKVPTSRQVASGTGLTGGGDLTADRTLAVAYGSSAATAVQGNDARVVADQVAGTASIRTLGTGAQQAAPGNDTRFSTAASTTVVGHVELADNTETQTGSDTVRAVTPAGLASVTATETRAGLAEVATAGEVSTGTDDARMVTPLKLKTVADLKADKLVTTTTQTGTTYTLVLADADTIVEGNNASAITFTVPPNSSVAYPVGTSIVVRQYGAGQITLAQGAGVTIRSRGAALKLAGQYAEATLTKRATDEWILSGDVTT